MLGLGLSVYFSEVIQTAIQKQTAAYKARVIADGGVFEANTCLEAQLTNLSNIQ